MCNLNYCANTAGERRRKRGRSRKGTELAALVRGALEQTILVELLPRAQVDVCIQVLFADGGVAAACINAAMLAVADAGAPGLAVVCATPAAMTSTASGTLVTAIWPLFYTYEAQHVALHSAHPGA